MDNSEHIQLLQTNIIKSNSEIYCKIGCATTLFLIIFIIVVAVKLK
jgi:hypothetical protein